VVDVRALDVQRGRMAVAVVVFGSAAVATAWGGGERAAAGRTGATALVSVSSGEVAAELGADEPAVSADGRYVAFTSSSTNLVRGRGDTNSAEDVFVRDRAARTTGRVSVSTHQAQALGDSGRPAISGDGRYVAFFSSAPDLVGGDSNAAGDYFVRDRGTGRTRRVSVDSRERQSAGDGAFDGELPGVSEDGRFVVFSSVAGDLVPGDTNGVRDVFVRDRARGTTRRVSVSSGETQGTGPSGFPAVSADGRFVAFFSSADNLVRADTNGGGDYFLRDLRYGTTRRVSVATGDRQASGTDFAASPGISTGGRYVAFSSDSSDLVRGDTNRGQGDINDGQDVFVRDGRAGTTRRVSVSSGEAQGNSASGFVKVSISARGRFVAFDSFASNLVPGDANTTGDVFVRDRAAGTTSRVSTDGHGGEADSRSATPALSADGRLVVFCSDASNLDPRATGGLTDVFVHEAAQ